MEDPKLPFIATEKVPQQDDTQLEILKQLKRQNDLLEEQLALQKEQKREEETIKQQRKDAAVRYILQKRYNNHPEKKTAYDIPITISYKACVFLCIALCGVTYSFNHLKNYITSYIRDNKLLNDERQLIPDKKLSEFLGVEPGKILSYDVFIYQLEHAI